MKRPCRFLLLSIVVGILLPAAVLSLAVALIPEAPVPPESSAPPKESSPTDAPAPESALNVLQPDGRIASMALEDYLTGVLLAEMPADFEPEALKAQAVVSATYALRRAERGSPHDGAAVCCSSACCQAYCSPEEYLSAGGSQAQVDKIRSLVAEASGQVLTYHDALIEATFFSCSGGSTEAAVAVWGSDVPYLQAVPSPGETEAVHDTDTTVFTRQELQDALGVTLSGDASGWFSGETRTEGGGIASISIGGRAFTGKELRSALELRSTAMDILPGEDTVTIVTHGYGHRVGMSQYGAQAMAKAGKTYDAILAYYYPGTTLTRWSD